MKKELYNLYKKYSDEFESIENQFKNECLHGPLLIYPLERYLSQKNKLMFIGQQTKGWSRSSNIKVQQSCYKHFELGINYVSSPFWNVMRKIENILSNEEYSSLWTNLSKYDVDENEVYGEYEEKTKNVENLLIDEINITDPKICLFVTGPRFDKNIKRIFKDVKFEKIDHKGIRLLHRLIHPSLPKNTFRTYHPNYLRMSKQEKYFLEFIKLINSEKNNEKHSQS